MEQFDGGAEPPAMRIALSMPGWRRVSGFFTAIRMRRIGVASEIPPSSVSFPAMTVGLLARRRYARARA
jgi:hypothetical protein